MQDLMLFALLGLGSGALFAGLALAVVVSYRGAGVVNLASGAFAMLAAYVFYALRTSGELFLPPIPLLGFKVGLGGPWDTVPAFVMALLVCAVTAAVFDLVVLRRLRLASP